MFDKLNEESVSKIKDLKQVVDIFSKFGVRVLVSYGALLGFYRDGKFLPGDDDIDLVVTDKVDFKTRKDIGWSLYGLGFNPQDIGFNVFGRLEPGEIGYNGDAETGIIVCQREVKLTIFFMKEEECKDHGKEMVCTPKLGALKLISSPSKFYKKFGEIKIGKDKYLTPFPIEEFLEFTYEDWNDDTKRDHGLTYFEMHPEQMEYVKDPKNAAVLFGKNIK
jgi:hypothetical protein